jgi:hypothetical protein
LRLCAARDRAEQCTQLKTAFDVWYNEHWRVVQINREFAAHFRPSLVQRAARALKAAFGMGNVRSRA